MSRNTPGANAHELDAYIGVAKEHRLDDETLVGLLRKNGRPERRVYGALSGGSGENARDGLHDNGATCCERNVADAPPAPKRVLGSVAPTPRA